MDRSYVPLAWSPRINLCTVAGITPESRVPSHQTAKSTGAKAQVLAFTFQRFKFQRTKLPLPLDKTPPNSINPLEHPNPQCQARTGPRNPLEHPNSQCQARTGPRKPHLHQYMSPGTAKNGMKWSASWDGENETEQPSLKQNGPAIQTPKTRGSLTQTLRGSLVAAEHCSWNLSATWTTTGCGSCCPKHMAAQKRAGVGGGERREGYFGWPLAWGFFSCCFFFVMSLVLPFCFLRVRHFACFGRCEAGFFHGGRLYHRSTCIVRLCKLRVPVP